MEHTEEKELYACCKSNATDTEACTDCTEEKTEEKCCGCHKTKHRSDEEYKKLIHRLNRIEGQIRGIRGMVEKSASARTSSYRSRQPTRRSTHLRKSCSQTTSRLV